MVRVCLRAYVDTEHVMHSWMESSCPYPQNYPAVQPAI